MRASSTARRSRSTTPAAVASAAAARRRAAHQLSTRSTTPIRPARVDRRTRPRSSAHTALLGSQHAAAYIGDFDSGATALSLPLNNENDVLQISPGSPYLGFTDGGPGVPTAEPASSTRYGGRHTFVAAGPLRSRRGARDGAATCARSACAGSTCSPTAATRSTRRSRRSSPPRPRRGRIAIAGRRTARRGHRARGDRRDPASDYAALAHGGRGDATPTPCCYGGAPNPTRRRCGSALHAAAAGGASCSRRARSRRRRFLTRARRGRGRDLRDLALPRARPVSRGRPAGVFAEYRRLFPASRRPPTRCTATRRCGSCSRRSAGPARRRPSAPALLQRLLLDSG